MKHMFAAGIMITFCLLLSAGHALADGQAETTVTIGTGDVTGVFYQAGGAISRIVNKNRQKYGVRCVVEATDGSVYNINAVLDRTLDFGFAQSDRQHQATYGGADWRKVGPQGDLRSMFSLYSEASTLCAAEDSGIRTITDLKGKRVNLGNPGSGHRQNSIDALTAAGLDYKKDLIALEKKASEAPRLLQAGEIDAFFYTVGHPTGAILSALAGKRRVRIISMEEVAKHLVKEYPYYVRTHVPIKYYRSAVNKEDIETFGVRATLITSAKVSERVTYAIAKEIFEKLPRFQSLHVAFKELEKEKMLENPSASAQFHPGAIKYYKEAGLMK